MASGARGHRVHPRQDLQGRDDGGDSGNSCTSTRAWLGRSGRGDSYGIEGRGREGLDQWLCSSQACSTGVKTLLSSALRVEISSSG
jgi:hypothetical protein